MSKSRNYVFTLNNYQDKPEAVALIDLLPCRYMKYGREVGEEGTPHLQGLVVFNSPISFKSATEKLAGCHVEVMKSLVGSLAYVGKDGDVVERGTCPDSQDVKGKKGKAYYQNIINLAKEDRIEEIDPQAQLIYHGQIRKIRDEESKKRKFEDTEERMEWYCGPSGTGKSRKAREENPEAYLKMCNKWWDGYENEDVVIIEDLDVKHDVLAHHLKIWGDRYPFLAEYKGGAKKIRPRKIIVTSNYHPDDIWTNPSDIDPIKRRFRVTVFGNPVFKMSETQPNFLF